MGCILSLMCIVCYVACGPLLLSSLTEKISKKHRGDIARREKRENEKRGFDSEHWF